MATARALREPAGRVPRPPLIDFATGPMLHRLRSGAGRGGALARAAGVRVGSPVRVIDATAGLGRDGFRARLPGRRGDADRARAGGPCRARRSPGTWVATVPWMSLRYSRAWTLLAGDARDWLAVLPAPQVVLVDPMHPDRGNTALVRQPMRELRALAGTDADVADLMRVALSRAERRVVLKCHGLAHRSQGCGRRRTPSSARPPATTCL